ncbi:Fungal-trans domain-containing protein [Fusarium sp. Ph1]|nr:Fungal-trans domain-containing protein [Fusarium sp. Ph1]
MASTQYTNSLLRCVTRKEVCKSFGIKLSTSPQIVQTARHAGFDSLFIDLEHAWLTLAEASNLCNVGHLAGITPFVRVPHQCGNGFVQRVLDGGAMGVIFPHIESADEAKAAVKISKYPPHGCRSMTGAMPLFNMRPTPLNEAIEFGNNSGSTVFAMIESKNAVNNSEEIAAVEGVDVLLVGSFDLSIDLGVGGNWDSKEYRTSMEKVSQVCRKHNKIFGVAGVYDNPTLHEWFINTLGARFMLVQQDLSLIAGGGQRAVRAIPPPTISYPSPFRASTQAIPHLPSEEEAFRLLETVSFYIGQTQCHYDLRGLTDRIGWLYENMDDPQIHELWYMQVLLVLAIGQIFRAGNGEEGEDLPGTAFFEFVETHLPTASAQYRLGRLAVEVNALMAMYLQMANRKEKAYLYATILHGYHQKDSERNLLRSEKAQINRLWWTIYMQERRLAAANGKPSGIIDSAISMPLPSEAPGFPTGASIRTNIKIAQVTGQVITILYGTKFKKEQDFVSHAQQIIKSLADIAKEIPSEQSLSLCGNSELALRTSASLHLMLYQATLLTIRPLMLHAAQLILSGQPCNELEGGSLDTLSKTCLEAARRLLEVIIALKRKGILPIFGFFDCDAVFSAAFIMLLTMIFDSACEPSQRLNPTPGLKDAMDMLHYMAEHGNTFARQRFQEVQSVRDHLSAALKSHEANTPTSTNQTTTVSTSEHQGSDTSAVHNAHPPHEYPSWYPPVWDMSDQWLHSVDLNGELEDLPLGDSFDQYQSLLNDPDWSLTGQDVGDFAELRRYIQRLNS